MVHLPRQFWVLVLLLIGLVAIGTLGYHWLEENFTLFDALYMTIITLSTIGYGEIPEPLSQRGRVFTIFLILGGVFTFFYSATEIVRTIVSGEVATALGKRKMERALAQLKDHIIVCGYGRMGRLVCREFSRLEKQFVVIDSNAEELKDFQMPGGFMLVGDATSDDVLKRAGIERALSLVTVMPADPDNLFVTMSARLLNSKLVIVARVEDMKGEQKLLRAGANRVVSPYQIGSDRVAHAVVKPTVVDFIELTTRTEHIELQMEESRIEPGSTLVGCNLKDSRLRAEHQIIIVAIKKLAGHMIFNPPVETVLDVGDILVAMGSRDHLGTLTQLASPR